VATEGPYTKAALFVGLLAIVVTYLVTAGQNHWWPISADVG
jgi:hypothetical protein